MTNDPLRIDGWEDLAKALDILRGGNSSDSVPSVELSLDSKGVVKPTVKVYNPDPHQASADAQAIFDQLRAKYA